MKKTALICLTFGWLGLAQGQLSCDDLDGLAGDLDYLAMSLEEVEDIGYNTPLDATLGELTVALSAVASVEDDRTLSRWISDLKQAWKDMSREDFEVALDDIIDRLDELGERDCEGW